MKLIRPLLPLLFIAFTCSSQAALVFTREDVADGTIRYDYNTLEDTSYINGKRTDQSFENAADAIQNVVRLKTDENPSLVSERNFTSAGRTNSFVWEFRAPENYKITTLQIGYRLTVFPQATEGNSIVLSVSVDGKKYTPFATVKANGTLQDVNKVTDLTSHVAGNLKYFIKGELNYTKDSTPDQMQIFRTGFGPGDWTGVPNASFRNTIGVALEP